MSESQSPLGCLSGAGNNQRAPGPGGHPSRCIKYSEPTRTTRWWWWCPCPKPRPGPPGGGGGAAHALEASSTLMLPTAILRLYLSIEWILLRLASPDTRAAVRLLSARPSTIPQATAQPNQCVPTSRFSIGRHHCYSPQ